MNKATVSRLLEISQECLYRFWQMDVDYALSFCAEDVSWIGSMQYQFLVGIDAVTEDFHQVQKEMKPCHLLNQQFVIAQNSSNTCTIIGQYLTTTDDNVQYYLQAPQRCTFVWEMVNKEPKIRHLHVSNAIGEMVAAPGEKFVNSIGVAARNYLENKIQSIVEQKKIVAEDEKGRVHFILLSEILYVSAFKKYVIVHTINGDIRIKKSFSETLRELGSEFLEVRRGEAVNMNYVAELRRYEIVMKGGAVIGVPVKRFDALLEQFTCSIVPKDIWKQ